MRPTTHCRYPVHGCVTHRRDGIDLCDFCGLPADVEPGQRKMHPTTRWLGLGLLILSALMTMGLLIQSRADAACARSQPGTTWNGDDWGCEYP